jgi:8-oxo-dGTP pyrophosphatase MutT (NUDIX family)
MNQQFMKTIRKWRKPIDWLDVTLSWNVFTYPDWIQQQVEKKRIEIYKKEQVAGKKIWDSDLYRVDTMEIGEDVCKMKLGIMKWSQMFVVKFCQDLFDTVQEENFASGIACALLLETVDGQFVFWVRNGNSAWKPWWDFALIWWTLHPDEWIVDSYQWLYEHLIRELFEEIWVPASSIQETKIVWIQRMQNGGIWFVYYMQLHCSKDDVKMMFTQRTDDEMTDLYFVDRTSVQNFLHNYCFDNWVCTRTMWLCTEYIEEIFIHTNN